MLSDPANRLGLSAPPTNPPKKLAANMRPNASKTHPTACALSTKGAAIKERTTNPITPDTSPATPPRVVPRATSPATVPAMKKDTHPTYGISPKTTRSRDPTNIPRPMLPGGFACKCLRSWPQFGQKSVSNQLPQRGQKVNVRSQPKLTARVMCDRLGYPCIVLVSRSFSGSLLGWLWQTGRILSNGTVQPSHSFPAFPKEIEQD
jgi:hypothetical protein